MRIYLLNRPDWDYESNTGDPDYDKYASFSYFGTMKKVDYCNKCSLGAVTDEPIRVGWDNGSDIIGDITWSAGDYHILVQERVKDYMSSAGFNCVFSDKVEYVVNPFTKKRQKHVKLPYTGPKLYWLRCEDYVSVDLEKSKMEIYKICPQCGRTRYENNDTGLVIHHDELAGKKMFKIKELGRFEGKYITEEACKELKKQKFSNLYFRLAGKVI